MSLMLHFKLLFSFALLSMLVVFFLGHILLPALYMLFFWHILSVKENILSVQHSI